jgi:hypothetical protein
LSRKRELSTHLCWYTFPPVVVIWYTKLYISHKAPLT